VVEPPIGIEPMTYALREARQAAPEVLPAQMAALASRNAPRAQDVPDSRSTTRSTASASSQVTDCYLRGPNEVTQAPCEPSDSITGPVP
jgi:hypothetical protein